MNIKACRASSPPREINLVSRNKSSTGSLPRNTHTYTHNIKNRYMWFVDQGEITYRDI